MNEPELESLYTVLAFDPGGTTGWAVIAIHDGVIGPPPFPAWLAVNEYNRGGMLPGQTPDNALEEARTAHSAEVAEARHYKILDNVAFWASGQFTGSRGAQVDRMVELTEAWPATCPLVVEGFILRTFRMDPVLLEPVRVTERYRQEIRDLGPTGDAWRVGRGRERDVIQQPPALAKTMVTDDRLRKMPVKFFNGTTGAEHARDAVRHALTFLRREKEARSFGRTLHVC